MRNYLVELQLPSAGAASLAVAGERARAAVEELAGEGVTVRWIRSVYVAEDDACFLIFEAPSRRRSARRAGARPSSTSGSSKEETRSEAHPAG
jgi:hypothetical protein